MRSLSPSLPLAALSKLQNIPFKNLPRLQFTLLNVQNIATQLPTHFCFFRLTDLCRFREIVLMGCTLSNRALWLCWRRWAAMPATRRLSTRSTSTFKKLSPFYNSQMLRWNKGSTLASLHLWTMRPGDQNLFLCKTWFFDSGRPLLQPRTTSEWHVSSISLAWSPNMYL